jgi:hypothetical protein
MRCAGCDLITTVTAGTAMHRSRLPLKSWMWAAYMLATDKRGVSALGLQRQLGLTRYETAYQSFRSCARRWSRRSARSSRASSRSTKR